MTALTANRATVRPPIATVTAATSGAFLVAHAANFCISTAPASNAGASASPTRSVISPRLFFILVVAVAVATAVPWTCCSTALRIISCASSILFDSTSVRIFCFSTSLKVMPERARAVTPFMGSWSALPSCTAFIVASPNPAAPMSIAAFVARSNAPPASSAVFAICENVRSLACVSLMLSAVSPVSRSNWSPNSCSRRTTWPVCIPNKPMLLAICATRLLACSAFWKPE